MKRTPLITDLFEDPMVRFKHHSLMQDYQELHMENESMRKRLQTLQDKKTTLMAEVRFLRRRYKHLRQDQLVMQPQDANKGRERSKTVKKSKKQTQAEVSPSKTTSEVEINLVTLPDLNQSGSFLDETKTSTLEKRVPLFDLNQISGEEEEEKETEPVKNSEESLKVEEASSCKRMTNNVEMKLLSCRNGGDGSNKRKISWQDPVITTLKV
ncbi:unnamed protein product [Cochlearia groenlandica]